MPFARRVDRRRRARRAGADNQYVIRIAFVQRFRRAFFCASIRFSDNLGQSHASWPNSLPLTNTAGTPIALRSVISFWKVPPSIAVCLIRGFSTAVGFSAARPGSYGGR